MNPGPRRELDRLRLIARLAAGMHEAKPLDVLLQDTADAIHDVLGFPNVDIPLLDPDDPFTLVVQVRGGHYKQAIRQVDRIPLGRGIMAAAVRSRRTELVNDVRVDPRYVCPPGVEPALAEMAVPIRVDGAVVGVLNIESQQPFDEADRLGIETVADFLGIAMRNLRLLPAAREAAALLERQRLARELHGNVSRILASIAQLTHRLEGSRRESSGKQGSDLGSAQLAQLTGLAQSAAVEMRMLLRELSPPSDAAGLPERRGAHGLDPA
jgi:two-component system, NarL family, sensor kinase